MKTENKVNDSKYSPIFSCWKRDFSLLALLLLIIGCVVVYDTVSYFPQEISDNNLISITAIKVLLSTIVITLIFISLLRIMRLYSDNLEKERNILSDLYMEEQKRSIVKTENDIRASDGELTEKIQSLTAQLEELKKSYRQEAEAEIRAQYQEEKIRYLEEINKQLLSNQK